MSIMKEKRVGGRKRAQFNKTIMFINQCLYKGINYYLKSMALDTE